MDSMDIGTKDYVLYKLQGESPEMYGFEMRIESLKREKTLLKTALMKSRFDLYSTLDNEEKSHILDRVGIMISIQEQVMNVLIKLSDQYQHDEEMSLMKSIHAEMELIETECGRVFSRTENYLGNKTIRRDTYEEHLQREWLQQRSGENRQMKSGLPQNVKGTETKDVQRQMNSIAEKLQETQNHLHAVEKELIQQCVQADIEDKHDHADIC